MRRSVILLAVLVVILGVTVACSKARNDQAIANEIQAKFFSDPQLKAANATVTVKSGEVILTGEMPSDTARYLAYKIASETPGVTRVNDQTTVKVAQTTPPPEPAPEPTPAPAPVRRAPKRTVASSFRSEPPPAPAAAAAPAPPATSAAAEPAPPPTPQPRQVEIPAGTTVSVRMIDPIDSEINHSGEVFQASLDAPLVVDNEVVVPAGTDVYVKLVDARSAGRVGGRSELRLELVRMQFQGKSYALVSSDYTQVGTSRGKRTAAMTAGGAGLGALIGAVAGGGKGAAIGAAVGAASGAGVQVATKGKQIRIPSEAKLDFRLQQPVEVTYYPEKNRSRR